MERKRKTKGKKGENVKVKQPISRAGMPTHQPSRADYLNSHNAMVSPTQMLPHKVLLVNKFLLLTMEVLIICIMMVVLVD